LPYHLLEANVSKRPSDHASSLQPCNRVSSCLVPWVLRLCWRWSIEFPRVLASSMHLPLGLPVTSHPALAVHLQARSRIAPFPRPPALTGDELNESPRLRSPFGELQLSLRSPGSRKSVPLLMRFRVSPPSHLPVCRRSRVRVASNLNPFGVALHAGSRFPCNRPQAMPPDDSPGRPSSSSSGRSVGVVSSIPETRVLRPCRLINPRVPPSLHCVGASVWWRPGLPQISRLLSLPAMHSWVSP